jgi:hypothetical protein
MPTITEDVLARFNEVFQQQAVPASFHIYYRKWLRYFLDFCRKYLPPENTSEQVRLANPPPKEQNTKSAVPEDIEFSTMPTVVVAEPSPSFGAPGGKHYNQWRCLEKSKFIPGVLFRPEIDTIISYPEYPFDIVVSLLYGCGLRLSERLSLRVQYFNFEDEILTVHSKGDKDRTAPLPQRLITTFGQSKQCWATPMRERR